MGLVSPYIGNVTHRIDDWQLEAQSAVLNFYRLAEPFDYAAVVLRDSRNHILKVVRSGMLKSGSVSPGLLPLFNRENAVNGGFDDDLIAIGEAAIISISAIATIFVKIYRPQVTIPINESLAVDQSKFTAGTDGRVNRLRNALENPRWINGVMNFFHTA